MTSGEYGTHLGHISSDEELRDIYAAADVFVLPSVQEAFGKTAAEALACGTPVVAFDATGPQDIVKHEKTGYLARPYSSEDMARGIEWILETSGCSDTLGANAAIDASARFSPAAAAEQYDRLYDEIFSKFTLR